MIFMKYRAARFAFLLASALPLSGMAQPVAAEASAGDSSVVGAVAEHSSVRAAFLQTLYDNPAMQQHRYATTLNRLALSAEGWQATSPQLLEEGDEGRHAAAAIDAYIVKRQTTLWGQAGYSNGRTENVGFTETSDYQLLYPYLMADTLACGTTHEERYDFSGGFASAVGNRWTLAAAGCYTARLDYRTRDPRPKNLTGHLRLSLAAALRLSEYQIGLAAHFNRYKQTNELKFYDEVNVPVVYHLTGVGTDYYRFRGENTSTYYKGTGGGFSLNARPVGGRGLVASLTYHRLQLDKIISTLNELPLATLTTDRQQAEVAWMERGWGVKLTESYAHRAGQENVFGSPAANMYPQISAMPQYGSHEWQLGGQAFCEQRLASWHLGGTLGAYYQHWSEEHLAPHSELEAHRMGGTLSANAQWQHDRWLLSADGALDYAWQADGSLSTAQLAMQSVLPPTEHRFSYLSQRELQTKAALAAHYDTRRGYALYAALRWHWRQYLESAHQNRLHIAVGLTF